MGNITNVKGNIIRNVNYKRMLIHSCNCQGSWGGGIAYQLAQHYPKAERIYTKVCEKYGDELLGRCLLIPTCATQDLIICCLFTSSFGGNGHDQTKSILANTRFALRKLKNLTYNNDIMRRDEIDDELFSYVREIKGDLPQYQLEMPQINSGIFGVPWRQTENLLTEFEDSKQPLNFHVFSL